MPRPSRARWASAASESAKRAPIRKELPKRRKRGGYRDSDYPYKYVDEKY